MRVSAEGAVKVDVQAQVDDRVSTIPLLQGTVVASGETQLAFSVQQEHLAAALKDADSVGLLDAAAVMRQLSAPSGQLEAAAILTIAYLDQDMMMLRMADQARSEARSLVVLSRC